MMSKKEFLPILAYSIPTYVLVYPSFFVNTLAREFPYWEAFLLLSLPFLGRIIGSLIYQFFKSYIIPLLTLSILTLLQIDLNIIFPVRFLIGIIFGLMTSYAVDNAVKTNNLVLGLTTAGWSIGWILSYIAYTTIHNWNQICIISSIIIVSIALLDRRVSLDKIKINISLPKTSSIIVYFSALTPAFTLQIIPSIFEKAHTTWLILPSYLISIAVYAILPIIASKIGLKRCIIITTLGILISGITTFLITPYTLLPYTSLGLGILSLIPKYLTTKNEKANTLGIALNIGSIGGLIIPTLYTIIPTSPESILIITSIILLTI